MLEPNLSDSDARVVGDALKLYAKTYSKLWSIARTRPDAVDADGCEDIRRLARMACDDLSAASAIVVLGVEDVRGESATPPEPVIAALREMMESFTLLTQVSSYDHLRSMPLVSDDEISALLNEPTSLAWLSAAFEQPRHLAASAAS